MGEPEMTSENAEVTQTTSESTEVTETTSESTKVTETTSEFAEVTETPVQKEFEAVQTSEASSADAAEAMLALQQQNPEPASTEAKKDETTYTLVMDPSMDPNQLDQQTFYIDSNTLANGNLVLHTEATASAQPQATNGHHQENGQNN